MRNVVAGSDIDASGVVCAECRKVTKQPISVSVDGERLAVALFFYLCPLHGKRLASDILKAVEEATAGSLGRVQ